MANEIKINDTMQISSGNLKYQSQQGSFTDDMDTANPKGPTPGAMAVSTGGTDVDLTQLTTPGWCRIFNLDEDNYVEVGIHDPETVVFYPLAEVGPGKFVRVKLSRNFGEEYAGAGTGTTSATNRLRIKANTAACNVIVEAFER